MSEQQPLPNQPGFEVLRHYLKDLSFESPHGPVAPGELGQIGFHLQVQVGVRTLGADRYTVMLEITASGKLAERIVLLAEVEYAADVRLHLVPQPVVDHVLGVEVPNFLIGFVKAVLEQNSRLAGYPPIDITNVDFRKMHYETVGARATAR